MKNYLEMRYKGYFRKHYGASFSEKDIENYRKWFCPQWQFINSKIKIKKSSRILELGSGLGGFYSLLDNSKPYIGLELDQEAVNFANKYFDKRCFKNASIENFASESKFDFIFAFEVLEHLTNSLATIQKIYNLLDNKGIFVGTTPYPFPKNISADATHTFVLHPENWKKILLESGFKKVRTFPMSFFPYIWRAFPKLNILLPFYIPTPGFISTSLLIAEKGSKRKL